MTANDIGGGKLNYGGKGGSSRGFALQDTSESLVRVNSRLVSTCVYDPSEATSDLEIRPRVSGTARTGANRGQPSMGMGNFANDASYIGARASGGIPGALNIYGLIILGRAATSTEIKAAEA